jgi:quercetin dioxygenase-like cupin family protein
MMAAAAGQQQQPAPQQGQAAAPAGRGNFMNNFTGTITVGNTKEMSSSRIKFEAGARTNWHLHSAAQLLLIEEGRGRLQELGEAIRDLPAGQPVLTKPNVLHWHGAAPDQSALQFSVYSGTLEWKEKVTDEEYSGKTIRRH